MHISKQEYRDLVVCPECNGNTIETIPVDDNEKYSLSIDKRRGIDIDLK